MSKPRNAFPPTLIIIIRPTSIIRHPSSVQRSARNRALLRRSIIRHSRVLVNLRLMVIQRSVRHRAHSTSLLLGQVRVGRRQVSADGADDGASGVCDGVFGVGVLEGGAGAGVLRGLRDGAVVVDDGGVVVGDFGVGDGAAGFGVGGVVVRVVGGGGRWWWFLRRGRLVGRTWLWWW